MSENIVIGVAQHGKYSHCSDTTCRCAVNNTPIVSLKNLLPMFDSGQFYTERGGFLNWRT